MLRRKQPRTSLFTALRHHVVSRVAACWLLALVLTPFTAPFRTFDLSNAPSRQHFDTLPKDKVDDEKVSLAPPIPLPNLLAEAAGESAPTSGQPLVRVDTSRRVLRI